MATHGGKHHKHHGKSRAERRRRGARLGTLILGPLALLAVLYLIDRGGPQETIDGMVVRTQTYRHTGRDRQGTHTHVQAILEYEGHHYTLDPGDRFQEGESIRVEVRRGRLTGYPYFVGAGRR